jgi:hypothetical protein
MLYTTKNYVPSKQAMLAGLMSTVEASCARVLARRGQANFSCANFIGEYAPSWRRSCPENTGVADRRSYCHLFYGDDGFGMTCNT